MKTRRTLVCLMAVLMLCFMAGCGAKDSLQGTWEASVEMSVLGVGVEPGQTGTGVIRFAFEEDGSGSMDAEFGTQLPKASRPFQYSTEGDQLTLEYTEGESTDTFTFTLEGDALSLVNHRGSFELTRVS